MGLGIKASDARIRIGGASCPAASRGATAASGLRAFGTCSLALLLAVAGCAEKEEARTPGGILARVGSREIRVADFEAEVARRVAARWPVPGKEDLLQEMVTREALLLRAAGLGLDREPEVCREVESILIGKLKERELVSRLQAVEVTPEEVETEYAKNIARYTRSAQVRLAVLYLRSDRAASEDKRAEDRARLGEARKQFLAQPPAGGRGPAAGGFGALAIACSDDQVSRYRGGDIGWLEEGVFPSRWPRAVIEAGVALKKGGVSEVMETEQGCYLVSKSDSREAFTTPLEKLTATLRQSLLVRKRHSLREAFLDETVRMAAPEIHREALALVEVKQGGEALAQNSDPRLPLLPGMKDPKNGN